MKGFSLTENPEGVLLISGVAWLCSVTQGHWLFSSRGPTIFKVWLPNQQGEGDGGLCTAGLNGADLEGPTPLPPILRWPGRRHGPQLTPERVGNQV